MHGFEWKDQRGMEGNGFVRALRSLLKARLPQLIPSLSRVVHDQIKKELSKLRSSNGNPVDKLRLQVGKY